MGYFLYSDTKQLDLFTPRCIPRAVGVISYLWAPMGRDRSVEEDPTVTGHATDDNLSGQGSRRSVIAHVDPKILTRAS